MRTKKKHKGQRLGSWTYRIKVVLEMRSPYKAVGTYVLLNWRGCTEIVMLPKGNFSWHTPMQLGR